MPKRPIVCDTTVLLYLGRIDQIEMLSALFDPVWVPESVRLELDMGRLPRRDTVDPRSLPWALPVPVPQVMIDALPPNRLGQGEQDVIAYANAHQGTVAGLDDLRVRQLAEALGLTVAGTFGLLLRSKRAGLVPAVRPLVDAAVAQGFHASYGLYQAVLELAGEAA